MKKYLFAALCVIALACSNKNSAGTTSETENELAVRVTMPNGSFAVGARVYLVDATHFDSLVALGKSPQIDSAVTDSVGAAIFSTSSLGAHNILVQVPGWAGLLRGLHGQNLDTALILSEAGLIRGHSNAQVGTKVMLDASGISATVNALGDYEFQNVPPGYFALFAPADSLGLDAFLGAVSVAADTVAVETNLASGFLLEDFDDGDDQPLLSSLGAGGHWYLYDDMAGTHFQPLGINSDMTLGLFTSGAYVKNSWGMTVVLDTNPNTHYGAMACKLGPDSGLGRVNFSALDSVSLWVKGSGQVRLFFSSDYIHTNYQASQAGADLGFTFTLPPVWTRVVIPADSLRPPPFTAPALDGVTWSQVSSSIDLLGIGTWDSAGSTVSIQVDEIRLYGISHTIFR